MAEASPTPAHRLLRCRSGSIERYEMVLLKMPSSANYIDQQVALLQQKHPSIGGFSKYRFATKVCIGFSKDGTKELI